MTQALNRCVSCLPGQRDVDNALRAVGDASKRLLSDLVRGPGMANGGLCVSGLILRPCRPRSVSSHYPRLCTTPQPSLPKLSLPITPLISLTSPLAPQLPPSTGTFQEAQSRLNEAAAGLNQAATELVQASRGTPQDLARASGRFGQDFSTFLEAGVEMAGQAPVRRV